MKVICPENVLSQKRNESLEVMVTDLESSNAITAKAKVICQENALSQRKNVHSKEEMTMMASLANVAEMTMVDPSDRTTMTKVVVQVGMQVEVAVAKPGVKMTKKVASTLKAIMTMQLLMMVDGELHQKKMEAKRVPKSLEMRKNRKVVAVEVGVVISQSSKVPSR